jgi:serine/threonine protein kinase
VNDASTLEALLARFVEHHVLHGERLDPRDLCAGRPDLLPPLDALVRRYLSITASLDADLLDAAVEDEAPRFEGFQTIERIGAGGMGEVYKIRDLTLNRVVAAKVVRRRGGSGWGASAQAFLREAQALALFSDRRIVQVFECRLDADPPAIFMEYVEGFELGRIGRSLDYAQRARVLVEVCEAIHGAHQRGLQHRDLKPTNIMVDAQLQPRILDFGLSTGHAGAGHFVGSLPYLAPEQLDPDRPIDARTDVYALGATLYELLAGRPPFEGADPAVIERIRHGTPRLPIEHVPDVPEPLQAIALTAMERDPARRYASALEMAADLRRYLDGRPVQARPSAYATTLTDRVRPHLDDLAEWLRLRLVYPHEAERLRDAYKSLEGADDEWIVSSRALSYPQIALYLGAFLLLCGSVFYFLAARWYGNVEGIARPLVVLGVPFIGLNAAAHLLFSRDRKAVAVAFYLGAIALLPLLLLIVFHEAGVFVSARDAPGQLFDNGAVSNRQLQITTLVASAWAGWLAVRTRTVALSTVFAVLIVLTAASAVADLGLRTFVEEGRWDLFALHFVPLLAIHAAFGAAGERTGRPWFSRPQYYAGAVLLVILLELLALDGRALRHLGLSLAPWQPATVSSDTLLDTVAAMTINGGLFYAAASLLLRRASEQARPAGQFLLTIAPFALLHPLGYLVRTAEYSGRVDWLYATCALVVALLSERRQRRSFYYAGLLNLGLALYFIGDHRDWFERPVWGMAVIVAGLVALAAGFALDRATEAHGLTRKRSDG